MSQQETLNQILARLDLIQREQARFSSLMDNDSGTGRQGLYQEMQSIKKHVKSVEERVGKLEEQRKYDNWRIAKVSAAFGVATGVILTFIKKGLAALAALTF